MAESVGDSSDSDSECGYGLKPPSEGVGLPNFKFTQDVDIQNAKKMLKKNLPRGLIYRGYVGFEHFTFAFDECEVKFNVNLEDYHSPIVSQILHRNYTLPRKVIDGIRWRVRDMIDAEVAMCQRVDACSCSLIILRLLEEATSHLQDHRNNHIKRSKRQRLHNRGQLDIQRYYLDSIHGVANDILGKTPAQICQDILPDWNVLHCENILRTDLTNKFLKCQKQFRSKLMNLDYKELEECVPRQHRRFEGAQGSHEQLVNYLTQTRIAFHGTRRELVPSIVQHGFLKPGEVHPITGKRIPVVNGSAYGRGIYSSRSASYALLRYSRGMRNTPTWELPGLKLLVCAVVMGRPATLPPTYCEWDKLTEPIDGADSHTNQSQTAYIVFDSAQILPCYVLHLDWANKSGEDISRFLTKQANLVAGNRKPVGMNDSPRDKQRKKAQLIAKGEKFFAYGFGPVSGRKIVIEDVAEVDDDEEDYGEYQRTRADARPANTSIWDADWGIGIDEGALDPWEEYKVFKYELAGETNLDHYSEERRAKAIKKVAELG